jgi:hypothetical protein
LEKDYDELPKLPPAQLHNGDNISKYKLRLLFTLAQDMISRQRKQNAPIGQRKQNAPIG